MNDHIKFVWLGIALGALSAQPAFGADQDGNYVEIGVGVVDDGNGKFGEFSQPLQDDDEFAAGALQLTGEDGDGYGRWHIRGRVNSGPGLDNRLDAGYKKQGDFEFNLGYDQIEKVEFGDALTVFPETSGSEALLPPGFTGSSDLSQYGRRDFKVTRDTYRIGVDKKLGPNWSIGVDYSLQDKDGEKASGFNQGFRGTGLGPEPIDYQHNQFSARADYSKDRVQAGVDIYYSQFKNKVDSLFFDNPNFSGAGVEQLDLPPDNEYFRIGLTGGYRVSDMTRFTWYGDWSSATQDDAFVPYAFNDNAFYSPTTPLPVSNLDGDVERQSLSLALTSRPTGAFDYKLGVDYRNRDTKHDVLVLDLVSYRGSVTRGGTSNHIYDKQSLELSTEGRYRFGHGTALRFGYDYEDTDRDVTEADHAWTDEVQENRVWAELATRAGDLGVKLKAAYSDIDSDLGEPRIEHLRDPEFGPAAAIPWFLTPGDKQSYAVEFDYPVSPSVSFNGSATFDRDDYDNDFFGIEKRDADTVLLNLTWAANAMLSATLYGVIQSVDYEQRGEQSTIRGGRKVIIGEWQIDTKDDANMVGLAVNWEAIKEQLNLTVDVSHLDADTDTSTVWLTSSNPPNEFPEHSNDVTRVDLTADYRVNERTSIIGRWIHENFDGKDWGWNQNIDDVSAVAFSHSPPDHSSNAFILSARLRF